MKKKLSIIIIIAVILAAIIGYFCYPKTLKYDMNFGFDLEKLNYEDVCFNVYHSNTEDHHWEKIASFPCSTGEGPYYNVNVECTESDDHITIELENSTRREGEGGYYTRTVEDSYTFEVEGYNGHLLSTEYFEIKKQKGEQIYLLYPISNHYGVFDESEELSLENPYDTENGNLDNILITIEFQ